MGIGFSQEQVERLRTPWDWRDLSGESPLITRKKIERAQQLGVVAVVFTKEQVDFRILELAALEHETANGNVDNTVYASLLKGATSFTTPFFSGIASLSPQMNPVVDYLQSSRYGKSQSGGASVRIVRPLDPRTDIKGKIFKKVDDVIDEGITADQTAAIALDGKRCFELGEGVTGPAKEVGIIALGDKQISQMHNIHPNMITIGMYLPNVWGGGRGLDGPKEAMRWAPEFVITAVQHQKYRDNMAEVLDILGERAVMKMKDITWISD
jgi:hypoxanthine-guanine phosphoribosyltransferase